MGGPHNKDYSILGFILGSPYFGKLPQTTKKVPAVEDRFDEAGARRAMRRLWVCTEFELRPGVSLQAHTRTLSSCPVHSGVIAIWTTGDAFFTITSAKQLHLRTSTHVIAVNFKELSQRADLKALILQCFNQSFEDTTLSW